MSLISKIGKTLISEFVVQDKEKDKIFSNIQMKEIIIKVVSDLGLNLINSIDYEFENQGYTYIGILSESHVSLHTRPENSFFTIDIFCCGDYKLDNIETVLNRYIKIQKCNIQIDERKIPI